MDRERVCVPGGKGGERRKEQAEKNSALDGWMERQCEMTPKAPGPFTFSALLCAVGKGRPLADLAVDRTARSIA